MRLKDKILSNVEIDELYAEKCNRDARARVLKAEGKIIRKYSVRSQQIHPMYVEDCKDTPAGRDTGFGIRYTKLTLLYGVQEVRCNPQQQKY